MADTIPGFLKTLTEWVVSVSQWFDGWDITLLVPALIILTVIAVALYLAWYVWYWTQHRNSRKVRRSHPD